NRTAEGGSNPGCVELGSDGSNPLEEANCTHKKRSGPEVPGEAKLGSLESGVNKRYNSTEGSCVNTTDSTVSGFHFWLRWLQQLWLKDNIPEWKGIGRTKLDEQ